ncbi:MAG: diguanylate cyclase, partial [Coriobacteriales bacterium]
TQQLLLHSSDAVRHAELYAASGDAAHSSDFETAGVQVEALLDSLRASEGYVRHGSDDERAFLARAEADWVRLKQETESLVSVDGGVEPRSAQAVVRSAETFRSDVAMLATTEQALTSRATRDLDRAVIQVAAIIGIVAVLGLAAIAIAGGIARRHILRPISQLRDAADRISRGELEEAVTLQASDEVAELGAAFEHMRVSLRSALNSLTHEVGERASAEEALAEANAELMVSIERLQAIDTEVGLVSEMGEILQADLDEEEAYGVVSAYGRRLFSGMRGALYLYESASVVHKVTGWGDCESMADSFVTRDCWALRTGRPHRVQYGDDTLPVCAHGDAGQCFECVPLTAHGEVLGTLTVEGCSTAPEGEAEIEDRLLTAFSEHVALALSNLRLRQELREQSLRDHLTGLHNRRLMQEALTREIARAKRTGTPLVVAMIDVDFFKEYNDTYGHDAGDYVLVRIADFLRDNTRAGDVACRYGGEEFLLIWTGIELEQAFIRAEAIRSGVAVLSFTHEGRDLGRITLSIGLAVYPDHGLSGEALIAAADQALYDAKADGRDKVVLADVVACSATRHLPGIP